MNAFTVMSDTDLSPPSDSKGTCSLSGLFGHVVRIPLSVSELAIYQSLTGSLRSTSELRIIRKLTGRVVNRVPRSQICF